MISSNGDKPKRAALFITSQRDFFLRQFDEFIKPLTYFSPAATYFKIKMFDQNERKRLLRNLYVNTSACNRRAHLLNIRRFT